MLAQADLASQQKTLEAKRLLVEEKRKRLNNTSWDIEIQPAAQSASTKGAKEKKEPDIIAVKDNQVAIDCYSKKGFAATNYTLTVQPDGSFTWETMQTSEKSGIAFWRGEIDAQLQKMQGVISYHIDDKTTRDFSFISTNKANLSASGN